MKKIQGTGVRRLRLLTTHTIQSQEEASGRVHVEGSNGGDMDSLIYHAISIA